MKTISKTEIINYIETPRHDGDPVRIDSILEARMKHFLRIRSVQLSGDLT